MNVRRGDVVLVDFPFPSGAGSKLRPTLIVQNNRDNARLLNTIAAQITGTTHRALEATQVFIEIATAEGRQSGLAFDSVVNCVNLVTLEKTRIGRKLGSLPPALSQKVDEALKAALELRG
jgi:mRNA interferase MazF